MIMQIQYSMKIVKDGYICEYCRIIIKKHKKISLSKYYCHTEYLLK